MLIGIVESKEWEWTGGTKVVPQESRPHQRGVTNKLYLLTIKYFILILGESFPDDEYTRV